MSTIAHPVLPTRGNAFGHGLDAYAAWPAWWVVVVVSAVPPAVLASRSTSVS